MQPLLEWGIDRACQPRLLKAAASPAIRPSFLRFSLTAGPYISTPKAAMHLVAVLLSSWLPLTSAGCCLQPPPFYCPLCTLRLCADLASSWSMMPWEVVRMMWPNCMRRRGRAGGRAGGLG